ncbi:MAG TPA: LysR family transcriptional regulator [Lacunisphaera sp.]|nr:LysR family transcriptional regulator [Lacunisphaera sp.]
MNIHHLELFYYVARHGGISAAVRHMPYGIQQPAVSSQILLLEEDLGVKLFVRQPFRLTPEGEEMLEFVRPFFENLGPMAVRFRRTLGPQLRIAASELLLRDHLPPVIERLKQAHPALRLTLRAGTQPELETWVREREIDLALLPLRGRLRAPLHSLRLLRLPLVLLVNKKSKLKSAAELWAQRKPVEPLICLGPKEILTQLFQDGLKRQGVTWPLGVEASSMELITRYVALGEGIGANIAIPNTIRDPKVRVLPLEGFPQIELSVLWNGPLTPLLRGVVVAIQHQVAKAWPQASCPEKLPA